MKQLALGAAVRSTGMCAAGDKPTTGSEIRGLALGMTALGLTAETAFATTGVAFGSTGAALASTVGTSSKDTVGLTGSTATALALGDLSPLGSSNCRFAGEAFFLESLLEPACGFSDNAGATKNWVMSPTEDESTVSTTALDALDAASSPLTFSTRASDADPVGADLGLCRPSRVSLAKASDFLVFLPPRSPRGIQGSIQNAGQTSLRRKPQ